MIIAVKRICFFFGYFQHASQFYSEFCVSGFSSAAKIKSLQEQVRSLELELQSSLNRQRSTSAQSTLCDTHAQQKAILNDSFELNTRLASNINEARTKIADLEGSLKNAQQTIDPLVKRTRQLETEKVQLEQESKTLRAELESWNNK